MAVTATDANTLSLTYSAVGLPTGLSINPTSGLISGTIAAGAGNLGGHLAAMSEFLSLGYNVAIPEMDRGDDVFVVRDADGDLSRIQVKTANARTTQYGYRATVNVPRLQLETPRSPEVYYVFPVRHDNRWKDFVVISRADLVTIWRATNMGSLVGPVPAKQKLVIQLAFRPNSVRTGGTFGQARADHAIAGRAVQAGPDGRRVPEEGPEKGTRAHSDILSE